MVSYLEVLHVVQKTVGEGGGIAVQPHLQKETNY
jgi:hypothetical protein